MTDLGAYIKAGYTPICGCNLAAALDYVQHQLEMTTRYDADKSTIECEIAPGVWTASGYYWEEFNLLKR